MPFNVFSKFPHDCVASSLGCMQTKPDLILKQLKYNVLRHESYKTKLIRASGLDRFKRVGIGHGMNVSFIYGVCAYIIKRGYKLWSS